MTPLFGRPGSYPACKSDACNCGRSDCPTPDKCVSEAPLWRVCDRFCGWLLAAIVIAGLAHEAGLAFFGIDIFGG